MADFTARARILRTDPKFAGRGYDRITDDRALFHKWIKDEEQIKPPEEYARWKQKAQEVYPEMFEVGWLRSAPATAIKSGVNEAFFGLPEYGWEALDYATGDDKIGDMFTDEEINRNPMSHMLGGVAGSILGFGKGIGYLRGRALREVGETVTEQAVKEAIEKQATKKAFTGLGGLQGGVSEINRQQRQKEVGQLQGNDWQQGLSVAANAAAGSTLGSLPQNQVGMRGLAYDAVLPALTMSGMSAAVEPIADKGEAPTFDEWWNEAKTRAMYITPFALGAKYAPQIPGVARSAAGAVMERYRTGKWPRKIPAPPPSVQRARQTGSSEDTTQSARNLAKQLGETGERTGGPLPEIPSSSDPRVGPGQRVLTPQERIEDQLYAALVKLKGLPERAMKTGSGKRVRLIAKRSDGSNEIFHFKSARPTKKGKYRGTVVRGEGEGVSNNQYITPDRLEGQGPTGIQVERADGSWMTGDIPEATRPSSNMVELANPEIIKNKKGMIMMTAIFPKSVPKGQPKDWDVSMYGIYDNPKKKGIGNTPREILEQEIKEDPDLTSIYTRLVEETRRRQGEHAAPVGDSKFWEQERARIRELIRKNRDFFLNLDPGYAEVLEFLKLSPEFDTPRGTPSPQGGRGIDVSGESTGTPRSSGTVPKDEVLRRQAEWERKNRPSSPPEEPEGGTPPPGTPPPPSPGSTGIDPATLQALDAKPLEELVNELEALTNKQNSLTPELLRRLEILMDYLGSTTRVEGQSQNGIDL